MSGEEICGEKEKERKIQCPKKENRDSFVYYNNRTRFCFVCFKKRIHQKQSTSVFLSFFLYIFFDF